MMNHRSAIIIFTMMISASCKQNVNTQSQLAASPTGDTLRGTSLSCKLTSAELQQRRTTVLASLKKKMIEKKELENGYGFRFNPSDTIIDELTEFIKTERACCDFFHFNLSVGNDSNAVWLELTGPEEAKEFIKAELEL
jgi:hypothetical protein